MPTGRHQERDAAFAISYMAAYSQQNGVSITMPPIPGNALVHKVRNKALLKVRPDADYVLLVDDDMLPEKDALLRLLAHEAPVASALCTTRDEFPPRLAVKAYDPDARTFHLITDIRPGAVLRGAFGAGAAFILIQREVIDRVREWHLEARDWLEINRTLFDRLHVRAENRERERVRIAAHRKKLFEDEGYLRMFAFSLQDDELERGEDIHFSFLLRLLGIDVLIDSNVVVGHLGSFPYSPYLMDTFNWRDVKTEDLVA